MARHRVTAKLGPKPPNWELEDFVAEEVEKVQVDDAASVTDFVRSFGSHYIAAYVTGNSLYQVLCSFRTGPCAYADSTSVWNNMGGCALARDVSSRNFLYVTTCGAVPPAFLPKVKLTPLRV